jgi:hypothetical protein
LGRREAHAIQAGVAKTASWSESRSIGSRPQEGTRKFHTSLSETHDPRENAGIPNPLFAADNTLMFFADGKAAVLDLIRAVKEA